MSVGFELRSAFFLTPLLVGADGSMLFLFYCLIQTIFLRHFRKRLPGYAETSGEMNGTRSRDHGLAFSMVNTYGARLVLYRRCPLLRQPQN